MNIENLETAARYIRPSHEYLRNRANAVIEAATAGKLAEWRIISEKPLSENDTPLSRCWILNPAYEQRSVYDPIEMDIYRALNAAAHGDTEWADAIISASLEHKRKFTA